MVLTLGDPIFWMTKGTGPHDAHPAASPTTCSMHHLGRASRGGTHRFIPWGSTYSTLFWHHYINTEKRYKSTSYSYSPKWFKWLFYLKKGISLSGYWCIECADKTWPMMEFIEVQGPFGDYECCLNTSKKHDPRWELESFWFFLVPFGTLWLINITLEHGPLIDDLYWFIYIMICHMTFLLKKYDFLSYVS